jgi:hypothetical protein
MELRGFLRRTITYPWARRIVVAVIGGKHRADRHRDGRAAGPAIVVIPLGLGILGLDSPGRATGCASSSRRRMTS